MADLLEPLVATIEAIKARIATHGSALRENETRTRMALIDPLLQALGWDTSDPASVLPEFDVSGRKADYALLQEDGNPAATIEAKKLGEQLASHRMQMLNYSNASGVEYAGLTDGDKWELYEVFKRGQLEDRRILDVSILDTPVNETALKLLLLWRPNLASGQPVTANPLTVDSTNVVTSGSAIQDDSAGKGIWVSLDKVEAGKGKTPPKGIKFPGREPLHISSWRQILIEAAEVLAKDGAITADKCPIVGLGIINSSPNGPSGAAFRHYKAISGGLYLDVNWNAGNIIRHSRKLLAHFGVSPGEVLVQLE